MTTEQLEEVSRRMSLFSRYHLDILASEKSLTENELIEIVESHHLTISQSSPQKVNLNIKSNFFKTKSSYSETAKMVLSAIIKSVKDHGSLSAKLGESHLDFNLDNDEQLLTDICIAAFFIRNQALINIYGEKVGNEIESHCVVDACRSVYGNYGHNLYDELKKTWLIAIAEYKVPHLEICNILFENSCKRTQLPYSENPLAEITIADILINSKAGIWLEVSKSFKLSAK